MAPAWPWCLWRCPVIHFDIDADGLGEIARELGATDIQVRNALGRALRRTEASLRKLSSKGLTKELGLRTATQLRNRLKSIRLRTTGDTQQVALWYGLNPLPVSSFKGRPREEGRGASMNGFYFKEGFIGKSKFKGRNTIFQRAGKKRLPIEEQNITVYDSAIVYIEDEIFDGDLVENTFWQHFRRDLKARVNYQIGGA